MCYLSFDCILACTRTAVQAMHRFTFEFCPSTVLAVRPLESYTKSLVAGDSKDPNTKKRKHTNKEIQTNLNQNSQIL